MIRLGGFRCSGGMTECDCQAASGSVLWGLTRRKGIWSAVIARSSAGVLPFAAHHRLRPVFRHGRPVQRRRASLANRLHGGWEAGIGFDPVKPGCTFRAARTPEGPVAFRRLRPSERPATMRRLPPWVPAVPRRRKASIRGAQSTLDHQKARIRIMLVIDGGSELPSFDPGAEKREFPGQQRPNLPASRNRQS